MQHNFIVQDKNGTTSLEFAYATMSDVSCIIRGGSHDCSLASHALSDVHHMIQVRCDQMKIKGIQHKYHLFLNVMIRSDYIPYSYYRFTGFIFYILVVLSIILYLYHRSGSFQY